MRFSKKTMEILWERISRTTSTTLPNRLRSGPKLPSWVIFGPARSLFGKVVEVVRLIRSQKILKGPQFEPFSPRA